jgi:DNA-directed RNA polymerase specialized sigma24 family protein
MSTTCAPVRLRADRHYESLRDAVWLRLVADDPRMPWAAFEDAYQEAWAWVCAQERCGREVVVDSGSPIAYLAQVVRRRYVDEIRARRRGVGRHGEGPVLELLDDHAERVAAPGTDDADEAREARRAVSAIYLLARERLSARELQAFALSYVLEMPPRDAAQAMGVSAKRFRNLRWDGWRKVGHEVVSLLEGRLHWCASDEAAELRARALAGDPQAAGPLRVHLACCAECSHSVASARRAAAAVLPLPMVLSGLPAGERIAALLDSVWATVTKPAVRVSEWAAAAPPSGRATAVLAVVAASAGGGAVFEGEPSGSGRAAAASPARVVATPRVAAPRSDASLRVAAAPAAAPRDPRPRRPRAVATEAAATRAPAPVVQAPPVVPAPRVLDSGEFGFE